MSLVENIARRHYSSIELMQCVKYLSNQGYSDIEIAKKTSLDKDYIHCIVKLLNKGENRLANAVEKKGLPIYIALQMANDNDEEIQRVLLEAHESGQLSGKKLIEARNILMQRKHYGKGRTPAKNRNYVLSSKDALSVYEDNIKVKKRLIKKSDNLAGLISFSSAALKRLLKDENFKNQLKVEDIPDIPENIHDLIGIV
jgi:ParB family chromosome partitioning protein